jgi:PAS domain S-box-containing protein
MYLAPHQSGYSRGALSASSRPAPPATSPINWQSLAWLLADKVHAPILVLDRDGVVRLVTSAAADALGWPRAELDGRSCAQTLALPDQVPAMDRLLLEALRGLLGRCEAEVRSADGRRLRVAAEINAVGEGAGRCLVFTIRSVRQVSASAAMRAQGELSYEVSLRSADLGHLTRRPEGEHHEFGQVGQLCYQAIYGFSAPCVDCPVRRPEGDPWPRVTVRRAADSNAYHLIRAHQVNADVALVTVDMLPEASVSALNEAKVRHLADQAGLTDRERSVLTCLLLGRTPEEIAQMLGIKARTVKFHQQNVLSKLGADSRVDLIRLIF